MPIDLIALSSVLLLPLAGVPAVKEVKTMFDNVRPEHRLESWVVKIQHITHIVCQEKYELIPQPAMMTFLGFVNDYIERRAQLQEQVRKGQARRFWRTKADVQHSRSAQVVYEVGMSLSTEADAIFQTCKTTHGDRPTYTEGKFKGKCVECYSETKIPLTWATILQMSAAAHGFEIAHLDNDAIIQSNQAAPQSSISAPSHKNTSLGAVDSVTALDEATSVLATIPLDEEENEIVEGMFANRLLSAGFSQEDINVWQ